ncbi:NmrA family NAD(P)-binding protein [Aliivibrio sifiae]|uniref:NmrA-like domain-containing protein n=1 Tax=Aliivibrio sifiae TaxID=566293 RepID=A0A2S7XCR3_9GAMM|nr:NAD(P)H-binding protein [Aliivibrio sifiae]PQJ88925.1 hypothetical protein BTO22_04715 [Aliivibrio sifiae]
MNSEILITGATGTIGSQVVKKLLQIGIPFSVGVRKPKNYIPQLIGGNTTHFDYQNKSHKLILTKVKYLFLIAPPLNKMVDNMLIRVIDEAIECGAKRIVLLSGLGNNSWLTNPNPALRKAELHLINSALDEYYIIRPNFFMDNFSTGIFSKEINENNSISLAAANGKTSFISAKDIAEVITKILINGYKHKEINLTGGEALTHQEVAKIISEARGALVTYININPFDFLIKMRKCGLNESSITMLQTLFESIRCGFSKEITMDLEVLLNRKPESFYDFAKRSWSNI